MALAHKPAVQVRAVRRVANAERPVVAVPALNRARNRTRADPHPQRFSGAGSAPIALAAGLAAGLARFGGINTLEANPLAGHLQGIRINDPGRVISDLNGDFADVILRRRGVGGWSGALGLLVLPATRPPELTD